MFTSLPTDICFVIPMTTLVWHTPVNKQRLIKEPNISKHLHHKESLKQYCESDTTCRLYHTEPLVGLRHVGMPPAYFEHPYIDYQLANIISIGTGMVKARGYTNFLKQTYRHTDITHNI